MSRPQVPMKVNTNSNSVERAKEMIRNRETLMIVEDCSLESFSEIRNCVVSVKFCLYFCGLCCMNEWTQTLGVLGGYDGTMFKRRRFPVYVILCDLAAKGYRLDELCEQPTVQT